MLLTVRSSQSLSGYLALLEERVPQIGLVRAKVADLVVAGDDRNVVESLLAAAYATASERGCHILEWVGFPREIRTEAERLNPFSRMLPNDQFHYKAASNDLAAALAREDAWYATLYDGDSTLD